MAEKTPMMLRAEKRLKRPLEEAIADAYRETGSMKGTAEVLSTNVGWYISESTLYTWRLRLGVSRTITITSPEHNPE